ncbi:tetratricopeptide repeat protein, partial [bacterium]|nr:tetratricopeptide repeat protein [bacterium]
MSQDEKWLVRSGGRIIGPFRKDQIPQLLKTREIQLRDEISPPLSRWVTLEFHSEFMEIVDQFKRELHQEKTEVSLTPTASGLTQTATDLADSELTEEITQDLSGYTNTKEIVVDHIDETPTRSQSNLESAQYQLKGLESNPYIDRKSKKTSIYIQLGVLFVALVMAGAIYIRFQSQKPEVQRLSASQLKSVVLKSIERGEYAEALSLMKARKEDPQFVSELGIYFALLSIQLEKQTLPARRVLTQLMDQPQDLKVRVLTGMGLSYLVDQNFNEAKSSFQQASNSDPSFSPVQVDVFIGEYLSNPGFDVSKDLSKDWVLAFPEALLTSALAVIRQRRTDLYQGMIARLQNHALESFDYRLEAQFLVEYLKWLSAPGSVDLSSWQKIADMDPFLTDQHRKNVFIYRDHLSWEKLWPLCSQMTNGKASRIEAQSLEIFCLFKSKQFQEARSKAESLVDKNPKYALAQAWYALALVESGSPDQGSVVLGRALEVNRTQNFRLPLLLQGRFCKQAKNYKCAYD